MLNAINLKEKHRIFSAPIAEVEHRTAHHADHAVLNVFETRRAAFHFDLRFDHPVVVSMIQGRKVMHLNQKGSFDFLPGQTIVMPASELMYIDFPDATHQAPTQCLALEISDGFVRSTLSWLNEYYPRTDSDAWQWTNDNFLLLNNTPVQDTLNRLISAMVHQGYSKQMTASNATRELIAALLQTQARTFLLQNADKLSTQNRVAFAVKYIREHLRSPISIDDLVNKACMSRAQFFRAFRRELGETPVQFIQRERLRMAKRLMLHLGRTATEACFECGFASLNYFSRTFRQYEGMSPTAWLLSHRRALGVA